MDSEGIIRAVKKYTAQIERCVEGKVPPETKHAIQSARKNLENAIQEETKPLDIDSLKSMDIVALFGFELRLIASDGIRGAEDHDLEIPGYLAQMIHEHDAEMDRYRGKRNVDHTRFKMLFLSCLAAENNSQLDEDDWVDAGYTPKTLALCGRKGLVDTVSYQGRTRTIDLVADYVLWYGSKAHLATNLVVFHSKNGLFTRIYLRRALTYMCAIQKDRRKIIGDACMYGIATNGEEYYFIHIDEKSKVSVHITSSYWPAELKDAYTHMRMFIAKAKQASSISVDEDLLLQHPPSVSFYNPESRDRE